MARSGQAWADLGLARVTGWLRDGQPERAVRGLLRAPDRAVDRRPGYTFVDLKTDLAHCPQADRLDEAVLQFLNALCAYRAGLTAEARQAFASYLDGFPSADPADPLWALHCAAQWSLALALRRAGLHYEGLGLAREAAGEARENALPWLEGAARLVMGRLLRSLPEEQMRARASFGEAYRLLSAATPPDTLGLAYVRAHEARLALDAGQAFRAMSLIREARSGFGRSRHHRALALSRVFQGWAHLQVLAVKAAIECGLEARASLELMGHHRGVLRASRLLAQAALEDRRYGDAVEGFEEAAEASRRLGDDLLEAEAQVGVAKAQFAQGSLRGVSSALARSKRVLETSPLPAAGVEWRTLEVVRRIRRGPLSGVPEMLRQLRGMLRDRNEIRLKAECLALCGFELARKGHLREAAPLLRESLGQVAHADAVAWTERFLASVRTVDVRQWITSLVTEIQERADVAEQYSALAICSYAGLHDAKNLAFSAWADLSLLETERPEDPNDSEAERALVAEANRLIPLLRRDYPHVRTALDAAKDKAFRVSALASDVAQQVLDGRTEIIVQPEPTDVKALLSGWREDIERRPGLGSCTLDLAGRLPRVSADGKYLGRVFENLASNAERYAPKSDIELSARVRRAGRRTEVVIGFADHGPGIHPEDIEIIFEPFKDPSQYRDQTAEHGFGFGLYYCRKVMEAHQSAIWVESRLGHGATFYLALPAST